MPQIFTNSPTFIDCYEVGKIVLLQFPKIDFIENE